MLKHVLVASLAMSMSVAALAQNTYVIDFESLTLDSANYDYSKMVDTGNYKFQPTANGSQGVYSAVFYGRKETWNGYSGFNYSNVVNTTTAGFTNDRAAITGKGYNNSSKYAIYYMSNHGIKLLKTQNNLSGMQLSGVYITNSTYATLSMQNGDSHARKFGGATGNDPDYFYVTFYGYLNGIKKVDTVNFYLADYRFQDNTQDYIVKDWRWVDLSKLGNVDSLSVKFKSSDVGTYGINTPAYFCMDNLTIKAPTNINTVNTIKVDVFPNPATSILHIKYATSLNVSIYNNIGILVKEQKNTNTIDVQDLPSGTYIMAIQNDKSNERATVQFVKQ